jgi:hypothetical protein
MESRRDEMKESGDVLTKVLAFWGAILSSIAFGWNLYRDLHDRARLQVKARARKVVRSPDGRWYQVDPGLAIAEATAQLFVVMNVTNIGRRPVQWQGWGGTYINRVNGQNTFIIVPTQLPKMLGEGETHSDLTETLIPTIENVRRLYAWDASGKNWYVRRRGMKKLRAETIKYRA